MTRQPAEVFAPSEFIREEIASRGWSVADLAEQMGVHAWLAEGLLDGGLRITRLRALCLGMAFGTGVELWLNLQRTWDQAEAANEK